MPSFAFAANTILPGTPRLDRPTLTALGVQFPISGDDNFNASVAVRYRKSGATPWSTGLPLFRVHPESTNNYTLEPQFAGSIFDLKPATTYEIELTLTDPDGAFSQTYVLSGTTRAVPRDPVTPRVVNVTDVSTLNAALAAAQPGDVITLANGFYSGQFVLFASGTAANPIVIRGASQDGVILDGQNCASCNGFEAYGSWTHVERLTLQNAERALRFQTANAQGNVIRRVHTKNTLLGFFGRQDQVDFYVADNILEGRLQWPQIYTDDNGIHASDDGIVVVGSGHVVAHNRISGFGDAMKNAQGGVRSLDYYGNDILYSYDNGVELDGGEGNIRLLRNRFTNTYEGISTQPIFGGPAYIIRNVETNNVYEQVKLHPNSTTEPNGILLYNNTFVSTTFALAVEVGTSVHHFAFLNNLFIGPAQPDQDLTVDFFATIRDGLFDYNGYWPDKFFAYNFPAGRLKVLGFANLQAAGLEPHGVLVNPQVLASGLIGPADYRTLLPPQDVSLSTNSIALNRGVVLANVSDGFRGSAPDLGALEQGCPIPLYGPRPEGVDEANVSFDCAPVCASDVSASMTVTRSGFRYVNATRRYVQTVTVRNNSALPLQGPLSLAVGGLPGGVTLYAPAGTTTCTNPPSPYSDVPLPLGVLAAGASASVTLEFVNASNTGIVYTVRLLGGQGTR